VSWKPCANSVMGIEHGLQPTCYKTQLNNGKREVFMIANDVTLIS
jgi:hypothetical protein